MKCYTHDRAKITSDLKQSGKLGAVIRYRSGNQQVLMQNGEQRRLDPKDRNESGKARARRKKLTRRNERDRAALSLLS